MDVKIALLAAICFFGVGLIVGISGVFYFKDNREPVIERMKNNEIKVHIGNRTYILGRLEYRYP